MRALPKGRRPSPALVISTLALFVAIGGGAAATASSSDNAVDRAIASKAVKESELWAVVDASAKPCPWPARHLRQAIRAVWLQGLLRPRREPLLVRGDRTEPRQRNRGGTAAGAREGGLCGLVRQHRTSPRRALQPAGRVLTRCANLLAAEARSALGLHNVP